MEENTNTELIEELSKIAFGESASAGDRIDALSLMYKIGYSDIDKVIDSLNKIIHGEGEKIRDKDIIRAASLYHKIKENTGSIKDISLSDVEEIKNYLIKEYTDDTF